MKALETKQASDFEALKELVDKTDLRLKTDLTPKQIIVYPKALLMAERYKIPELKDFVENIMQMKSFDELEISAKKKK